MISIVFQSNLRWVAAAIALPSMVVNAVLLPWYAARVLPMRFIDLLTQTWTKPLLCCLPAVTCLIAAAMIFPESRLQRLLIGGVGATLASGWFYWSHAVPPQLKLIISNFGRRLGFGIGRSPNL